MWNLYTHVYEGMAGGIKICWTSDAINGAKSDVMSGVRREPADDVRCGKLVGSYAWLKEPTCHIAKIFNIFWQPHKRLLSLLSIAKMNLLQSTLLQHLTNRLVLSKDQITFYNTCFIQWRSWKKDGNPCILLFSRTLLRFSLLPLLSTNFDITHPLSRPQSMSGYLH